MSTLASLENILLRKSRLERETAWHDRVASWTDLKPGCFADNRGP